MTQAGRQRRLAAFCAIACAPMLMGAGVRAPIPGFEQRLLTAHNEERESVGVPPLRWSARLADAAQGWADQLASTERFRHAPFDPGDRMGENIWWGTKGHFSPEDMTGLWIDEKRHFKSGVFPHNSTTGRVRDVGHFTQVIWRASSAVGCAVATGKTFDVLVCRYSEPGNARGMSPF